MSTVSHDTDILSVPPENSSTEPLKKRGIVRRLYDWVLSWADTPYGTPALFVLSFAESSFFPIPPDVLQVALSAGKPKRSFFYATVNLVGSVLGALVGYLIGFALWGMFADFFFKYVPGFTPQGFDTVKNLYHEYGFGAIFTAAMTPIPYKLFTIVAGVCEIGIPMFIIASIIGRGLRFYAVASLLYFFGPTVKSWIEQYFEVLAVVFCVLLIGGFFVVKFLLH
ncbi:MAG TPA: cytochrome B [Planctomycetaceae bacterium]|nr:cytochrome B [Planctomycetaceae bacterium]